mgnify:CR=1 FL=1
MITPIKFDKRLYDKHFKSGELTRDVLNERLETLPDLAEQVRYRSTENPEAAAETEGDAPEASGSEATPETSGAGESHEQG